MSFLPIILLLTAAQIVAGALLTGGAFRRSLGALVAAAALVLPWLLPKDPPWARAALALGIVMTVLRTIDLAREKKPHSLLFRILHVAIPFDTRRIVRAAPQVRFTAVARVVVYLAAALCGFYVARDASSALHDARAFGMGRDERLGALALRWGGGLLLAYAITDFAYGSADILFGAVGFDVYELHRTPAASLSVKEFWGDRWNRSVSMWFREHCLKPLARRTSAKLGALGSFVVSGAIHAYLVLPVLGVAMALVIFAYFIVQAGLVLAELQLHSARWNKSFSRAWTITVMVATSPLFVEPALRVLGV